MKKQNSTAQKDEHIANYRQFIESIALHTSAFGKPVLLMNGDSHVYRSDNPLMKGAPCVTESVRRKWHAATMRIVTQPSCLRAAINRYSAKS